MMLTVTLSHVITGLLLILPLSISAWAHFVALATVLSAFGKTFKTDMEPEQ